MSERLTVAAHLGGSSNWHPARLLPLLGLLAIAVGAGPLLGSLGRRR